MPNLPIQKLRYQLRYRYPTRQIASIVAVVAIVLWFIWGSVVAMQKNYSLRANVAAKKRERSLVELQMKTLEYEQAYLKSDEYRKLAVRERLGKGDPGEKVVVLPANSPQASAQDSPVERVTATPPAPEPSNFSQWLTFLLGGNANQ